MSSLEHTSLIIIGGAEDKKKDMTILKKVCSEIDAEKDEMVIATVATELPENVGKQYVDIFKSLGIKKISVLNINSRQDAYNQNNLKMIENASLIFFTGGDQLRITSNIGGTPLYNRFLEKHINKCIFVGTSAGASVMSDTMIIEGPDEESPRKCTLKMAPGLGLIKDVLIDQHFAQRGRIGRLLVGIAENPQSLGVGIDEDTAIVVDESNKFSVIGSGAVYIVDGGGISRSNVSEQHPSEILSIFNVKMHVLKSGDYYDINMRMPFENEADSNNS
ncbi:cyanophycinase [Clostridium oryzae]|uniref:cyanophycinase n=1 Tax=Clostridium oryzae TaxID=1450648 RepID=UPI003BFA6B89